MAIEANPSIVVNAPIQKTWDWMMNNESKWRTGMGVNVPKVERIIEGKGPHGEVGAQYRSTITMLGIPSRKINEITAYDPPRKISWYTVNPGPLSQDESSYILEETPKGTKVTLDFVYVPRGIGHLMEPLARPIMHRILPMLLDKLKTGVEAEVASG